MRFSAVFCKGGVTLVNLQRQLATIRCCAKNYSSVTPRCGQFFAIFAVLQRVARFWKRFKSVTCLQIRAKYMRCESALQVDQCNTTLNLLIARLAICQYTWPKYVPRDENHLNQIASRKPFHDRSYNINATEAMKAHTKTLFSLGRCQWALLRVSLP